MLTRSKRVQPEQMTDFVEALRGKIGEMVETGVDLVHLVYAGPVAVGAVIGAELANSCRVILYQHEQGRYLKYGPLKHTHT